MISASYGQHSVDVGRATAEARASGLMGRIRDRDHSVWSPEPAQIGDRLGWLRAPTQMRKEVARIVRFASEAAADFHEVLLLGMGGSSLAADAFSGIFGVGEGGLPLRVVDTTDPAAIAAIAESTDPLRTLHIVATKSGTTVETLSAFRFFHARVRQALGAYEGGDAEGGRTKPPAPGALFAAITDPGSPLSHLARDRGFREIFLNAEDVGGRFSALTFFGLVPAALLGVYVAELLERADAVMKGSLEGEDGRALGLGVALGVLARVGRDKLTISTSPDIAPFAPWLEQLVAESTGKGGTGIVPIVGERLGAPGAYGADRVFVDLAIADDDARNDALAALERSGHPVIRLHLRDPYDVGGQIALWELAVAVAAAQLGVNPFDQPDVEAAKLRAREAIDEGRSRGAAAPAAPGVDVRALEAFLDEPRPPAYIALQAFLPPSGELDEALGRLRIALRDRYGVATTAEYGPRFLHSTGQLHKGGAPDGLFVQLTAEPRHDLEIPDPDASAGGDEGTTVAEAAEEGGASSPGPVEMEPGPLTFGALEAAQAEGDRRALKDAGRRVVHFDAGANPAPAIRALAEELSAPPA